MKKFGCLLITVGFLAGALVAVWDKKGVRWGYFAGAFVVGVVGVVVVRTARRRASTAEGELAANIETIETALGGIVENVTRLNSEKQSIDTYDVRHRVDELFLEDINTFVQARQSIAQVYGLAAYGDVMSHFAAGERYLNRVWSASADGYVDEVNAYLDKAHTQFVETLGRLTQLSGGLSKTDGTNP